MQHYVEVWKPEYSCPHVLGWLRRHHCVHSFQASDVAHSDTQKHTILGDRFWWIFGKVSNLFFNLGT